MESFFLCSAKNAFIQCEFTEENWMVMVFRSVYIEFSSHSHTQKKFKIAVFTMNKIYNMRKCVHGLNDQNLRSGCNLPKKNEAKILFIKLWRMLLKVIESILWVLIENFWLKMNLVFVQITAKTPKMKYFFCSSHLFYYLSN